MRLKEYLNELKNISGTMIGYGLSERTLEPFVEYVRSWFDRYDIEYKEPMARHITIGQITSVHPKDEMVRIIDTIPIHTLFKPVGMTVFEGKMIPRDFFVIEYKPTKEFYEAHEILKNNFDIRIFGNRPKPHVSLFNVEKGSISPMLINDMMFHSPNIPVLKPTRVELWNSRMDTDDKMKFFIEYTK